MLDEYGQERPGKWCIKVNLLKIADFWHHIKHPKKKDYTALCKKAKKRDAEFEAWRSRPTKNNLTEGEKS